MKPVRNAFLGLAVVLLAAVGFVGCSGSSQNQPEQNFAQGSNRSASSSARNFAKGTARSAPAPQPVTVTIPRGTDLRVALDNALSSATAQSGERFTATLLDPVRANGQTIIPSNARLTGHVVEALASGRLSGVARLALTLDSVEISGQPVAIRTDTIARSGSSHKKRDIIAIGGGSAVGAIVGGIAGGGKGAAIGAAAGAGAGTAGAAATGKKDVKLPVETTLAFRLTAPIHLTRD